MEMVSATTSRAFADPEIERVIRSLDRSLDQLSPGLDRNKDVIQVILDAPEFQSIDHFLRVTHEEKIPRQLCAHRPSEDGGRAFYRLSSAYGSILWQDDSMPSSSFDLRGLVYVKGVFCFEFTSQRRYGVDLPSYVLSDRNRNSIDESLYRHFVALILASVVPKYPWLGEVVLDEMLQCQRPTDSTHLHALARPSSDRRALAEVLASCFARRDSHRGRLFLGRSDSPRD